MSTSGVVRTVLAIVGVVGTIEVFAQGGQGQGGTITPMNGSLTIQGKDGPVQGVVVNLYNDGKYTTLGTTATNGQLLFSPAQQALLAGKSMINLQKVQCPNKPSALNLIPDIPANKGEEQKCEHEQHQQDCSCKKVGGGWVWGTPYTIHFAEGGFWTPVTTALVIGGAAAAAAGIGVAAHSGNSNSTSNTPPTTTLMFSNITGLYALTGTAVANGTCTTGPTVTANLTVGGNMTATTFQFIGPTTINYTGSTTQQGSIFNVTGTSAGTDPTRGPFTSQLSGSINFPNVTVTVATQYGSSCQLTFNLAGHQ